MHKTSLYFFRYIRTLPRLVLAIPAAGATGVDVRTTIQLTLTRPINLVKIVLLNSLSLPVVTVNTHPGGNIFRVLITPSAPLPGGETYSINIVDSRNRPIYPPMTYSFTTPLM